MNKINPVIIICYILVTVLAACESHEQKADDAFEKVKSEKLKMKDTIIIMKDVVPNSTKIVQIKKVEAPDEWTKFKTETEKKIMANEIKIKQIKSIPNTNSKVMKQLMRLEKDNNELRKNMDQYKEEAKVIWETFKIKINHDVNDINIELKDLTINNSN